MSQEEIKKRYDRLLEKTRQVRGWQKQWYKYHVQSDLQVAKRLERELDQMIAEEVKIKESNQGEIF